MKLRRAAPRRQRGMALIIMLTVLILGVAWFTVGALGKAAPSDIEREVRTGAALRAAKQALLGYLAQHAARSDVDTPGQMPCPESLTLANPGVANTNCGNAAVVGRLPWRTLGVDQIRDGYGEPLWYALSGGFRTGPINFDTPGQLAYNGAANAAVAIILAPGRAVGAGGCNTTNQVGVADRYAANLVAGNFLECGNAAGNYADGTSAWHNDRLITITAAEWADAVAPGVTDRLQREVAPVLENWRQNEAWANWARRFMPYASTFGNPSANDQCGDQVAQGIASEGLLPLARSATSSCSWWQTAGASVSQLLGVVNFQNCTSAATGLECRFLATSVNIWPLGDITAVQFDAIAPGVAASFRAPINWANVTFRRQSNNAPVTYTAWSLDQTLSAANGRVSMTGVVILDGLFIGTGLIMQVNNLPDAATLGNLPGWYVNNSWERHTYYSVAPAATVNPGFTWCNAAGDPGCITISGLPATAGNTNDKRFALVLMGRRLPGTTPAQTAGTGNIADYLELRTSATQWTAASVTSTQNDRFAACPSSLVPTC